MHLHVYKSHETKFFPTTPPYPITPTICDPSILLLLLISQHHQTPLLLPLLLQYLCCYFSSLASHAMVQFFCPPRWTKLVLATSSQQIVGSNSHGLPHPTLQALQGAHAQYTTCHSLRTDCHSAATATTTNGGALFAMPRPYPPA